MADKEPCQTTFCKVLPLSGEGIVSVNSVQRSTPFAIRIRPAPCGDDNEKSYEEKRKCGYVEVAIGPKGAVFKYRNSDGKNGDLASTTGKNGGLEIDKRVSYWFSFNRNGRILKYGKGYFMEETTLLMKEFPFPKSEGDPDPWKFIFRPDQSKEIVIKDMYGIKGLVVLESSRLREGLKMTSSQLGVNEKITADLWSSIPRAERSELAARVDVEKKVSFYPHPLTCNWSPFVLDSSEMTLLELASNRCVPSASLPETCQELYANIASPHVVLDWPDDSIPRLSDAINYSISTKGKILYEKLNEKKQDQGMSEYLRVTLGRERGSSPGVPY